MDTGYALFYENREMNLNYFAYYKRECIRGIVDGYGEPWERLRKRGFSVRRVKAKEVKP